MSAKSKNNYQNSIVAFILPRVQKEGGISRVTSIISNELIEKMGFDVHVISYQECEEGYDWNKNITFHEIMPPKTSLKKGMHIATPKIRHILRANKITWLIACGQLIGPLAVLCTLFNKTKMVYWSHSSFLAKHHDKLKPYNERFSAMFCDKLVSLTKEDEINYRKIARRKKICQIYNPVDPRILTIPVARKKSSNLILSVGRLSWQKNFLALVEVAKRVLPDYKDWQWHIYGMGYQYEELKEKIENANLKNQLILKGHSTNMYELYNNYDLMVMTSRFEGFPMSLVEGMSFGLPLVSFDIPTGPKEIIKDRVNGYLIKPFDIDKMAEKISHVIENSDMRKKFYEENKILRQDFYVENIIQEWKKLLV